MKSLLFFGAAIATLVTACASPEQLAEQRRREAAAQQARYEARMNSFRAACRQYGYREGSDQFAACVERTSREWAQRARQAQAEQEYRERCFLGATNICEQQPKSTTQCLRDAWGNMTCTTR